MEGEGRYGIGVDLDRPSNVLGPALNDRPQVLRFIQALWPVISWRPHARQMSPRYWRVTEDEFGESFGCCCCCAAETQTHTQDWLVQG